MYELNGCCEILQLVQHLQVLFTGELQQIFALRGGVARIIQKLHLTFS